MKTVLIALALMITLVGCDCGKRNTGQDKIQDTSRAD
jgi:uncharacterized lipoprotein